MSKRSKREYLQAIRSRYHQATKRQKQAILDEFCTLCGYNRKYAIRLLNSKSPPQKSTNTSKRGRKRLYHHPLILEVLTDIWIATNLSCGKRLKAIIALWLPHYDRFIVPEQIKQKLLN